MFAFQSQEKITFPTKKYYVLAWQRKNILHKIFPLSQWVSPKSFTMSILSWKSALVWYVNSFSPQYLRVLLINYYNGIPFWFFFKYFVVVTSASNNIPYWYTTSIIPTINLNLYFTLIFWWLRKKCRGLNMVRSQCLGVMGW